MKLADWINEITPVKVAELLEVDSATVYNWRLLKTIPNDQLKKKIVDLTHGLVSYGEMIEPMLESENQLSKK